MSCKAKRDWTETSSTIIPSAWLSHFQNLNELKTEFKQRLQQLEHRLSNLEKSKFFTDLDTKISESEISTTISSLKINKSPGLDNISNNYGQTLLIAKSSQNI